MGQGIVFLVTEMSLVTYISPTKLYLLISIQHLNSTTSQGQIFYMYCLEEFLNLNEKKKASVDMLIFMVRLTQRLISLHNVNRALQLTKDIRRLYCLPKEEANIPPQYEQSYSIF